MRRVAPVGLFLAIAFLLVFAGRVEIFAPNMEVGDFAANSLLIQDAKSLDLWVGNYSRIGFNHPGPAILYVLALGELVLHDWLRLLPSPFSGQLVGVALYNALWITLVAVLLRRMLPLGGALLGTAAFVALTGAVQHDFLLSIWFPYLYYFPFAVAVLALARVAEGDGGALWIAALAGGFLVNGHVSFIVLLGLMLVLVLAYNVAGHRREPARNLLHPVFLRSQGRDWFVALAVVALFLLPLAVMTVKEFPGPLADYARFGQDRPANRLVDALRFTGGYWGGRAVMQAALLACAVLAASPRLAARLPVPGLRGIAAAVLAATAAVLFYAVRGMDSLAYRYLALFYYAVPVLLASVAAVTVLSLLPLPVRRPLYAVGSIAVAAVGYAYAARTPEYAPMYRQEEARAILQALQAHRSAGRLVLDLDGKDGGHVWSYLVGAQALAKRAGQDVFCVAKNWHILFTKPARCTLAEQHGQERLFVARAGSQPLPGEVFAAGGLSFARREPPNLLRSGPLTVAANADTIRDDILRQGWSGLEPEFVWSDGPEAGLSLALPPDGAGTVLLDLAAFLPRETDTQRIELVAAGQVLGRAEFRSNDNRKWVRVAVAPGTPLGDVRLRIERPLSPSAVWASGDTRQLGVALFGIKAESR